MLDYMVGENMGDEDEKRGNTHHLSELFKRLEEGKNAVTVRSLALLHSMVHLRGQTKMA